MKRPPVRAAAGLGNSIRRSSLVVTRFPAILARWCGGVATELQAKNLVCEGEGKEQRISETAPLDIGVSGKS